MLTPAAPSAPVATRRCRCCYCVLPVTEFRRLRRDSEKRVAQCRDCRRNKDAIRRNIFYDRERAKETYRNLNRLRRTVEALERASVIDEMIQRYNGAAAFADEVIGAYRSAVARGAVGQAQRILLAVCAVIEASAHRPVVEVVEV